jgi:hypothetical protein
MDVVPTIAHTAHLHIGWRVNGHSVFGPAARRIPSTTLLYQRSGHRIRLSLGSLNRRAREALHIKLRLFGSRNEPPGLFGIGPFRSIHGKPVSSLSVVSRGSTRAAIDAAGRYARVRRSSGSVPVRLMGKLTGTGNRKKLNIAVAVNGTVVATAPTFAPRRGAAQLFSVLVPESSLRDGKNNVELYALIGHGTPRLRPLT